MEDKRIVKYLTFGCGQMLGGYQIKIVGRRLKDIYVAIHKNFGNCWSSTYNEPASEKLLLTVDLDNCDFDRD